MCGVCFVQNDASARKPRQMFVSHFPRQVCEKHVRAIGGQLLVNLYFMILCMYKQLEPQIESTVSIICEKFQTGLAVLAYQYRIFLAVSGDLF